MIGDQHEPDRVSLALARIEILRHLGAGSIESGIIVAAFLDDVTVEAWTEQERRGLVTAEDAELLRRIGDQVRDDLAAKIGAEQLRRRPAG